MEKSASSAEPAERSDECCGVHLTMMRLMQPNFVRPGRYEACGITLISLVVACVFWTFSFVEAISGQASLSILENGLESFIDFASTAAMLYRLASPDALQQTPRNAVLEARTSAILALSMTVLGLINITASIIDLTGVEQRRGTNVVSVEAVYAVPAAFLYLVVGVVQLQMAWTMQLRSLKQDALISLLGAVIAIGSLTAALANMMMYAAPLRVVLRRPASSCLVPRAPARFATFFP